MEITTNCALKNHQKMVPLGAINEDPYKNPRGATFRSTNHLLARYSGNNYQLCLKEPSKNGSSGDYK